MTLHELPELIQGTEEWHDQRRGIVTASVVGQLVATRQLGAIDYDCPACAEPAGKPCVSKVKKGGDAPAPIKTMHPERAGHAAEKAVRVLEPATSDYSRALTATLTAERITNYTEPTFMSDDMYRGVMDEPRARDLYSEHFAPATETGFMVEDKWGFKIGFSPDGLVSSDGLIEVKSRRQKKHLQTILADAVPAENMAQLQCGLLVSGREWIDYLSYCGGMPMWRKRVFPDPEWQVAIVEAVAKFEESAAQMVAAYSAATTGLPATERVVEMEMVI